MHQLRNSGSHQQVDGVVCYHEQMTIEVADHVAATLYSESNPYFLANFYPIATLGKTQETLRNET